MKVVWSPLASQRVREIGRYIARDKPGAARRWVKRIFSAVALLADAPERGRAVPEAGRADIRELLFGEYRVVYRLDGHVVSILTVRHGRRMLDLDELEP